MSELVYTPPPWRWVLNPATHSLSLESGGAGERTVLDLARWGMKATIRFSRGPVMEHAISFAGPIEGRLHHRAWALQINHPDARLIEAAPTLLEALIDAKETIKNWYMMNYNNPDKDTNWKMYEFFSPEMQRINKAIELASGPGTPPVGE